MVLVRLDLANFRNFKENSFSFSPNTTLILGPNTSGKTNILEAIYLLATGHSFRAEVEREMIRYGKEMSNVKCSAEGGSNRETLEIILTTGEVMRAKTAKKFYKVNGVGKRMVDFVGLVRSVLFWPEDLNLVTNSPSLRRKYLDLTLSQVDREYRRSLLSYEKGLRQRNKLLEKIRDEGASRSQLLFWDQLLVKNGGLLTDKRIEFIEFVNNLHLSTLNLQFKLGYDKSVISADRLEQYAQEEVAVGATLVGPHRDDFKFLLDLRDLSCFGSRGEQRLAVLWLKLCELEFISQKTGERPILLLDDIFSELDHEHRKHVLELIPQQQTIITTTDLHLVEKGYQEKAKVIELG
ncbi:MAG: DNA replication and repair protein RecF [Microgenomates group bacterium LiPW_16]|nr:MAG: DNA replication and repair protein RecF [Microgenomates group bacterium LiPW_16]